MILTRYKYIVVLLFGIPMLAWELYELVRFHTAAQWPLVSGIVVRRERVSQFGVPRGRVTVRLADSNTLLVAIMKTYDMDRLQDSVAVHYSGNSSSEVVIKGEENPVKNVVALAAVLLGFSAIYFGLRNRPGWEGLVEGPAPRPDTTYATTLAEPRAAPGGASRRR